MDVFNDADVVSHFLPDAEIVSIRSLGDGNINETCLVVFTSHPPAVLQKINRDVFADPEGVAVKGWLVAEHLSKKREQRKDDGKVVLFIPTREGQKYYLDPQNGVWRMQRYIENTAPSDAMASSSSAYEGGKLLGCFHLDLDDFPREQLTDPIPGFHNLPGYCSGYRAAARGFCGDIDPDLAFSMQEVEKRLEQATILEDARRAGVIRERIIHGDPKAGNMLLDSGSGRGVALIDLDTVARGLLMYDLGDCLRSFCNPGGETPGRPEAVGFDIGRCEEVLQGYAESGASLTKAERELVYQGVRLMTYELAVRFLTDYLMGNRYFKVRNRLENLHRAMTQIQLLQSIEAQQGAIEECARGMLISG